MSLRLLPLLLLALLVAACNGAPPAPAATATVAPVTGVPAATVSATVTAQLLPAVPSPVPATATATVTAGPPTPTLPPIRATVQALSDAVQIPTREGARQPIAAGDYEALAERACQIVRENYLDDSFNGVDWEATCAAYQARAARVDTQEAFWDLMEALIAELGDEHSRFVRPARFAAEFRLPSEGGGRPWPGLEIWPGQPDDHLLLWDVCDSGPAARAGLRRGDQVLAVNGEPVQPGWDRADVGDLLYGDGAQAVQLTVRQGPDADPREVELAYGGASGCDGWGYGLLRETPRIGYVRVPSFGGDAAANIRTMLGWLEEEGALQGLVVDVRHNPGGNADEAIGLFAEGTFGLRGPLRADATQTIWRVRGPVEWSETTPLAVLIDGASASAAEYFAVALQQAGRATLVGTPTAGNTEGITGFSLPDGSLIRLAVSTLELPDGTTLEGRGVQPDRRVPLGGWGLRQRPDVQVQAALDVVRDEIE